jgi:uncharacterized membrane protein YbhN (UPF0104 family)
MTDAQSRALHWLRFIASEALFVAAAFFLAMRLLSEWNQLLPRLQHIHWGYLTAALAPTAGMLALMSLGWTLAMRQVGVRLGRQAGFSIYYRSSILRYLPGSFWYLPGRAYFCQRRGIALTTFAHGAFIELFCLLNVAGILAGLVGLVRIGWGGAVLLSALCSLVIFATIVWPQLLDWSPRLSQCTSDPLDNCRHNLFCLCLVDLATWVLYGSGFYIILLSMSNITLPSPLYVLSSNTAAWLLGFVSFVPAGLGIREGALVFLLPTLSADNIIIASIIQRILELGLEGIFWLIARSIALD